MKRYTGILWGRTANCGPRHQGLSTTTYEGDSPEWSRSLRPIPESPMYVVELSLKLSPMPIAVQRKELADAQALYATVRQAMEGMGQRVLELSCEKEPDKKVSLLSSEVVAVQVYEKSASGGGGKRPGFSFDS